MSQRSIQINWNGVDGVYYYNFQSFIILYPSCADDGPCKTVIYTSLIEYVPAELLLPLVVHTFC